MPHGIIVFGASGSGTTTLGRKLACILGFKHLDADDFFWMESEIPFTIKRPREDRIEKLLVAISGCRGFVLSGSICGWDEPILPLLDLAVYITTPTNIRIERLKHRESTRFGKRIFPGGDMYDDHLNFLEWAAKYDVAGTEQRSHILHEQWMITLLCPSIRVNGEADCNATATDIAKRFYVGIGEPWMITTTALNDLKVYRFTVVFARYNTKWLYARHRKRDTFETAGGHIESDETPLDCAKREFYEETGATNFHIYPAFDYSVHTSTEFSYGQVFFANIETLEAMPADSEMIEIKLFDTIPDKMTYPAILPVLYENMQKWLERNKIKQ